MKRIILSTLVVLTALGGVAAADRPDVRDHRGGVYVHPSQRRYDHRPHHNYRPHYNYRPRYDYRSHYRHRPHHAYSYGRPYYVRPTYRYVRRPIYVRSPAISVRYFDYYQRPTLIAERYGAMAGYFWVPGQWRWNGYEWIWTPGHYEPDPSYTGYYSNTYNPTYYQANPYYDPSYIY